MINKYFFRIMGVLLLAVLAVGYCKADVIVLTGTTETTKPKASLVASDLVLWCESAGVISQSPPGAVRSLCGNIVPSRYDTMQPRSFVLTDMGWYRNEEIPTVIPTPLPYPFLGYTCFPKDVNEVRIGNGRGFAVGLWYCDTPTKIQPHYYCGDPKNIPVGKITLAKLIALAAVKRKCMADELTLIEEISDLKPTVVNGKNMTAPAYKANTNGTRNTKEVKRVDVGTLCNWKMRLVDSKGKGTSFYAVVGEYALYANCQLNGPISK